MRYRYNAVVDIVPTYHMQVAELHIFYYGINTELQKLANWVLCQ